MNAEKAEKSMEAKEKAFGRLSTLFEEVREDVSYTAEPEHLMRMFNQYARVMFGPHLTGVRTKTLDVAAKANMCLIAEKRKMPVPLEELAQAKHSWMRLALGKLAPSRTGKRQRWRLKQWGAAATSAPGWISLDACVAI